MSRVLSTISDTPGFIAGFKKTASLIPEGVIITDAAEKIVWVNKAFEKICGCKLSNLRRRKTRILPEKSFNKRASNSKRRLLVNGQTADIEILNCKPGKTPYKAHINISPVLNEKKVPVYFIGVESDISPSKKKITTQPEKLYRSLFEKNPEIMFVFDPKNYKILEANETALRTYEYSREEFLNLTIKDIRPPEDWEKVLKILPMVKGDFVLQGTWRHAKKSGEIFLVDIKATQITYKGKKAILVIPKDVTEKIHSENVIRNLNIELQKSNYELRANNEKLKQARDTAKIGTWEFNLRKGELTGSDEMYNIFEFDKDIMVNFEMIRQSVDKDYLETFDKSVRSIMNCATAFDLEYKINLKEGRHKIVVTKGALLYDEIGQPEYYEGITIDITEKKQQAELIADQLKKMNIILGSISDPFYIIDKDYKLLFVNDVTVQLVGYPREYLIGKNIWDVIKNHDFSTEKIFFAKAFKDNKTRTFELDYHGRNFSVTIYPSEIGLAVTAKDITDSKKTEEELLDKINLIKGISDNLPGGLIQTHYHTNGKVDITYLSEGFKDLWGVPLNVVYNDSSLRYSFIHPDDVDEVRNDIANCVRSLQRLNHIFRYVNQKTGEVKWVRALAEPKKLEDGSVKLTGVFVDINESQKYYEQLEESNKRFEYLAKASAEIIWEVDLSTMITTFNGKYEKILGCKFPDNKADFETRKRFIHPDDIELVLKQISDVINDSGNRFREYTFRINTDDGSTLFVNEKTFVVCDEKSGKPVKVIGSTQDITEQKLHKAEMEKSAKFLKEISESLDGFIFQIEFDNGNEPKLNYISEKAFEFTGDNVRDALAGKTKVFSSIHPEDIGKFKKAVGESVASLTPLSVKFRQINHTTGKTAWVRGSALPSRLPNGHTILNGVVLNVTETEDYYNKLEEANRRYEYISKASHETIWELDLATEKCELGGAYKEMFGYEYENNILSFEEHKNLVYPGDFERLNNSKNHALSQKGRTDWEESYSVIRKDGRRIFVEEKAYIIYDDKTNLPVKIVGVTQDVTHVKKIEEERKNIVEDLINRNKALEQFTYMVSHNLRAPIANILGISALLEESEGNKDELKQMHELLKKSSINLDNVIHDMNEILAVKKNENGKKTYVLFSDVMAEVKDFEKANIESSGVKLQTDFSAVEGMKTVHAYMYSIFLNLISNGIKYGREENPFVKVRSYEDENNIFISFEDNGIGIDLEANKSKIFGLYSRFHLNKEGKGMGLFMAKSQVESLGGEITVESEVNKGTKFVIKLKK